MPEDERAALDSRMEGLQGKIREVMSEIKDVDQALKEEVRDLNRQVATNVLGTLMSDLRPRYKDLDPLSSTSAGWSKTCSKTSRQFRPSDEPQLPIPGLRMPRQEPDLARYEVNLIVDNGAADRRPGDHREQPHLRQSRRPH